MASPPHSRYDFRIAIICALGVEAEMAEAILDKNWKDEGTNFRKVEGDQNTYSTGLVGKHNVILVYMPSMGSNPAAGVTVNLKRSFPNIEIVFVVGICGAVPKHPESGEEIILGDCIIGTELKQYDFGRLYPDGFVPRTGTVDCIAKASLQLRSFMNKIKTSGNLRRLAIDMRKHIATIQAHYTKARKPEIVSDRLFPASYAHKHSVDHQRCEKCSVDGVCTQDCGRIGCDVDQVIERERLRPSATLNKQYPRVYTGCYGSANTVMKSGTERDRISTRDQIVAYEMECSGVWEHVPAVIVKSACDYADSHKNKDWQSYAATTAAACLKAMLEELDLGSSETISLNLPSIRVTHFVPRPALIQAIDTWLSSESDAPLVLVGMGGAGKSQLALNACREAAKNNQCSIVAWLNASSESALQQSLKLVVSKLIGENLVSEQPKMVIARFVKELHHRGKRSLIVFDNFDDPKSFVDPPLPWYMEQLDHSKILVTTRRPSTHRIGEVVDVSNMLLDESLCLLLGQSPQADLDRQHALRVVDELGHLALALDQAGAYIRSRNIGPEEFLEHYKARKQMILQELPEHWSYHGGDLNEKPLSAFTTWELSLGQLRGDSNVKKAKEHFLTVAAFFDRNSIRSMFFEPFCISSPCDWTDLFCHNDAWDEFRFSDIIAEFRELSIVQSCDDANSKGFVFHPVIQEWLRLRPHKLERQRAIEECTSIFGSFLYAKRFVDQDLTTRAFCVTNIDSCLKNDGRLHETTVDYEEFPAVIAYYMAEALYHNCRDKDAFRLVTHCVPALKNSMNNSESLYKAQKLQGGLHKVACEYEEAVSLQLDAYETAVRAYGEFNRKTIYALAKLGHMYSLAGSHERAIEHGERAVALAKEYLDPHGWSITGCQRQLGWIYYKAKLYQKALPLYEQVVVSYEVMYDPSHYNVLSAVSRLGAVLIKLKHYDRAESYLRRAVKESEKVVGPTHENTLTAQRRLAGLYVRTKRYDDAEKLYTKTLKIAEDFYGRDSTTFITAMANLGWCLLCKGSYYEAESYLQHALDWFRTKLRPEHNDTLATVENLATVQYKLAREEVNRGTWQTAEQRLRTALDSNREAFGEDDRWTKKLAAWLAHAQARVAGKQVEELDDLDDSSSEESESCDNEEVAYPSEGELLPDEEPQQMYTEQADNPLKRRRFSEADAQNIKRIRYQNVEEG